MICNYRPEKEEKERARLVLGGDRINFPGDVGTPTADMLLVINKRGGVHDRGH